MPPAVLGLLKAMILSSTHLCNPTVVNMVLTISEISLLS